MSFMGNDSVQMEGLMKKIFILYLFIFSLQLTAQEQKVLGTRYFIKTFGHIHKGPDAQSSSLTGIMCGTKLKVLEAKDIARDWLLVEVGGEKGYVLQAYTSETSPKSYRDEVSSQDIVCFQGMYPRFFSELNLNITEQFYWGKLYDHYASGESKVPVGQK